MMDKNIRPSGITEELDPSEGGELIGKKRPRGRPRKHIGTIKYDFDLRYRGLYREPRGADYLKLKAEYNVDGARLVERVFADAELIITARAQRKAGALKKIQEAQAELLDINAGGA